MIIDAHVHYWDPSVLRYPWLDRLPSLRRAFLPEAVEGRNEVVFVECNVEPAQNLEEVAFVEQLASDGAPIAGIVAFADMTSGPALSHTLDALARSPLVRGVRHNIQGHATGFCVTPEFIAGVREVGARGLTFDICATHDQLGDVVQLVEQCPNTQFVLDHCGKPAIRAGLHEPWCSDITWLAAHENVVACKVSGLLTEAGEDWTDADLLPYVDAVLSAFGTGRVMYGSDWPVVTLAGSREAWVVFVARVTSGWEDDARQGFFHDNAVRIYNL